MDILKAAKSGKCTESSINVGQLEMFDEDGNTALMIAAINGHSQSIITLVRSGANVDILGKGMNTALLYACKGGHADAARELVFAGASVNIFNEGGDTPLLIAVKGGHEGIVELLLDRGADVNGVEKADRSPLFIAVVNNVHPVLQVLLERGANLNLRSMGSTPLVEASCKNMHQSVVLLLKHGADPNIATSEAGNSALYWASQKGSYATAKALLDAGANSCHATKGGYTPLNSIADELMKRLIRTYQTDGGPSWLVQQLYARGLEWPVVCDIEDKLLKEGFVSKEIFLAAPMSLFTHEYLRSLGILHFGTRLVVITVRLEGTWLGARLAGLGVSPFWIRSCETCVFEALGCGTKKAYANLPAAVLSAETLKEVGVPVQYHLVLRALHEQLSKAREEKEKEKETKITSTTEASTASSTNAVVN